MKHLIFGLSLAALAASTAYAAQGEHPKRDANTDGIVSRAEAQAFAGQMFTRMDANKDGKLDAADREAHRAAMFDRIDANKDGQISREEFNAAHQGPQGRGPGQGMGMGKHMGGHMRGGHMHDMAMMADADKDGAISQAEFNAAAMQRFEQADSNKDGRLTQEERQAAHAHMREQMREHMQGDQMPGMRGPDGPARPGGQPSN